VRGIYLLIPCGLCREIAYLKPMEEKDKTEFMKEAIKLAIEGMNANKGGPFGAVVVRNNLIIGKGCNKVTSSNDPTAHAEIVAIREACKTTGSFNLEGCELFTTCEPCPMCLGAIYWAGISRVYYACTREDAANLGFDDLFIYKEFSLSIKERKIPFIQLAQPEAREVFKMWDAKSDKKLY